METAMAGKEMSRFPPWSRWNPANFSCTLHESFSFFFFSALVEAPRKWLALFRVNYWSAAAGSAKTLVFKFLDRF